MAAIPAEYGYVIGTGFLSVVLNMYLGFQVASARRPANVPYPYAYADMAAAEADPKKKLFNCYQRAHQNFLENYPGFLMTVFAGGLQHPITSAAAGLLYLVSRLIYARGYQTGDPAKRMRGQFGYLPLLVLWGTTVSTTVSLIRSAYV